MPDPAPTETSAAGNRPPHVMAVSSSGGHWVELLRLAPAWEGCRVSYVTTSPLLAQDLRNIPVAPGAPDPRFFAVPDASRWNKLQVARLAARVAWLVLTLRPDVIVSTGSAPGYLAFRVGRLTGARTIWLESIANVDELSMSGQIVAPYADLWMTQWEHQATQATAHGKSMVYAGKVL